jgi:hypothetical protein
MFNGSGAFMNKATCLLASLCLPFVGHAEDMAQPSYSQYQAAVGLGFDQGLSAILDINRDYRLALGNDGIALDYTFKRGSFNNPSFPADWYLAAGAWKNWESDRDLGVRVPVGLNWTYRERLQIYGQVHPELSVHDEFKLGFGAAVGVTYTF